MIDFIMGFFNGYKNWIIGALIIGALSFVFYKGYNTGYNKGYLKGHVVGLKEGIAQEKARLDIEYNTVLAEKLKENTINLQKQFDLQLEAEKASKQSKIEYVDRVETITKYITTNPKFDDKVCKDKLKLTPDEMKIVNRKENE